MNFIAEIPCTRVQASLVEWALDAMADVAGTEDFDYTEDDLPILEGLGDCRSLFLRTWRAVPDLLYRLEEQYPSMAEASRQSIAAAERIADAIRAKARSYREGQAELDRDKADLAECARINAEPSDLEERGGGAEIAHLGRSDPEEEPEPCHFPPRLGCEECAARLATPRPRNFVLVHDPKARTKSFWTGACWTKKPDQAKVYRDHEGEPATAAIRKRGFSKAALMPHTGATPLRPRSRQPVEES